MAVKTETKKVVVMILRGSIDIEDMLAMKNMISTFIEKENIFFLLDFSGVEHINVSGIEYINERKERSRALGGDIKIIGANDYVRHLFLYAGYWGEFEFWPSEEEAVKAFEKLI